MQSLLRFQLLLAFVKNDTPPVMREERSSVYFTTPLFSFDSLIGGENNVRWACTMSELEPILAIVIEPCQAAATDMAGWCQLLCTIMALVKLYLFSCNSHTESTKSSVSDQAKKDDICAYSSMVLL
jgi:hypothetical protein